MRRKRKEEEEENEKKNEKEKKEKEKKGKKGKEKREKKEKGKNCMCLTLYGQSENLHGDPNRFDYTACKGNKCRAFNSRRGRLKGQKI